jgi:hypothetical protein
MLTFEKNFQEGVKTLEDLYILGGADLSPLIDKMLFHFSEMRSEMIKNGRIADNFSSISKLFSGQLDEVVQRYFFGLGPGIEFHFSKDVETWDLQKWELVFTLLPGFMSVVREVDVVDKCQLIARESEIIFKTETVRRPRDSKKEKMINQVTKQFLRHQALLTGKLREIGKNKFEQTVKLDFSHNSEDLHIVSPSEGTLISFSSIFGRYRMEKEKLLSTERHLYLFVDKSFKLSKKYQTPQELRKGLGEYEIMHFPFLFRPVSLIIPGKGRTISKSYLQDLLFTGSGCNEGEQEVKKFSRVRHHHIDLFSVFKE